MEVPSATFTQLLSSVSMSTVKAREVLLPTGGDRQCCDVICSQCPKLRVPEQCSGKVWSQYNTKGVWSWSLILREEGGNKLRFIFSTEGNISDPDKDSQSRQCLASIVFLVAVEWMSLT
jgi:hypothetical protein